MISSGELLIVTPTIPQSIQALFNDHQARLAAVSAAPGVVGLSLDLDQISATYLSRAKFENIRAVAFGGGPLMLPPF
jgi:hypothetical protein